MTSIVDFEKRRRIAALKNNKFSVPTHTSVKKVTILSLLLVSNINRTNRKHNWKLQKKGTMHGCKPQSLE
jgi:hypothetical protein